jgi:hypothetical protein
MRLAGHLNEYLNIELGIERPMLMGLMQHFPNHIYHIEDDWEDQDILNLLEDLIDMKNDLLEVTRTIIKAHSIVNGHISFKQAQGIVEMEEEE